MNEETGEPETLEEFAEGSILPMRICERLDGGPLVEVITCHRISGGKNYKHGMPKQISLTRRFADGTEYRGSYHLKVAAMPPAANPKALKKDAA